MPRTRRTRAPRRSRPRAFDWLYLDAVVLQRLARHADSAARLEQALRIQPGYLPARVMFAEALLRSGRSRAERGVCSSRCAASRRRSPRPSFGLGRIAAAAAATTSRSRICSARSRCFPEFGAAYYALALPIARSDAATKRARALEQHAQYGPRWPALDDPVLARRQRSETMRGPICSAA